MLTLQPPHEKKQGPCEGFPGQKPSPAGPLLTLLSAEKLLVKEEILSEKWENTETKKAKQDQIIIVY